MINCRTVTLSGFFLAFYCNLVYTICNYTHRKAGSVMENQNYGTPKRRPTTRRRRKRSLRSKIKRFMDTYSPLLVIAAVVILFVVFISGSINRSNARREQERNESIAAEQSEAQKLLEQEAEANRILMEAEKLAAGCDYDGAIALLDSFTGDFYAFDALIACRDACVLAKDNLVEYSQPASIMNLSFHQLIVDPQKAFTDDRYGDSYPYHYITTSEFAAILQELYENGYILVDFTDFIEETENADGSVSLSTKSLYLPQGKKPLMITQTQANYYTYMVDSDGDGLADKGGDGFASRLIVDGNGNLTNEYVDNSGTTVTGNYDVVPILEDFIARNPGFSYRGARAVISVSGYDGLFGYRTNPEAEKVLGEAVYQQQLSELPAVVQALRDKGYRLACYTYGNVAYGKLDAAAVQADIDKWEAEVTPLLSQVDTLVFAKNSDISEETGPYTGDKFNILRSAGFRYFIGFWNGDSVFSAVSRNHVRTGRLMVTGNNLENNKAMFEGLFTPDAVLDTGR